MNIRMLVKEDRCKRSQLNRIIDWEDRGKEAEFKPGRLATLCGVSLRQLERFWRIRFNVCPKEWLKAVQIQHAKSLLMNGLSVKETAYLTGFKQLSHLSREFKRHTGTNASAYCNDCGQLHDGDAIR